MNWSRSLAEKAYCWFPSVLPIAEEQVSDQAEIGFCLSSLRGRDADQSQGLVWVGRRADKPNDEGGGQWWQMPQGGIDKDEPPKQQRCVNSRRDRRHLGEVIAEAPTGTNMTFPII